jgi:predicted aminopeptidase
MIRRISFALPLLTAALLAMSCSTTRFYTQAVAGQMEILRKSRPSPPIIADPTTDPTLREKLQTIETIRRFASNHLALPGHASYGRYADLGRDHVVWVLYAAPEFSLDPKQWRYPLLGELNYRGYFRQEDTLALADSLREDGFDVHTGGVTAYSTLGWFHDPVLNTFVLASDTDLAELLFHELTHRRLFRRGQTMFNESMANAVAEEGVKRWLAHEGRTAELKHYEARLVRRMQFYEKIEQSRDRLETLYQSQLPAETMRKQKALILTDLREDFLDLRRRWGGRGLESWIRGEINNASLVATLTYHQHIPTFKKLLADSGGDFEKFFRTAKYFELPTP